MTVVEEVCNSEFAELTLTTAGSFELILFFSFFVYLLMMIFFLFSSSFLFVLMMFFTTFAPVAAELACTITTPLCWACKLNC